MTMIYPRIADKTAAEEYFTVTEKVEALYHQPHQLDADTEGNEMRKLRAEMHRSVLGNGYCARPVEMDAPKKATTTRAEHQLVTGSTWAERCSTMFPEIGGPRYSLSG